MSQRHVFQFKVTLQHIEPQIWRSVQVSDLSNFWKLHMAIQNAMGWENCHLFEFEVTETASKKKVQIGLLAETARSTDMLDCEVEKVKDYILNSEANRKFKYIYDFGDHWEHIIEFEGAYDKISGNKYPQCIAGERACPPEDVGGPHAYMHYLEILKDPTHEEYEDIIEWFGEFEPDVFESE